MSTIKNSIRIYIPQGNGIEAGFYDVIGYYGPDILIQSNYYIIDVNNLNYPLIKSGTEYFYLPYDAETGYSVSALNDLDYNNSRVHALVSNTQMMIYLDKVGDFNGLGYDYPLCENISISNISTLVAAYRAYHMEIFDSYAIRTFDGTIHDEHNIIDSSQEEIILVETNPDNYVFDPEGGTVKELYRFTVDCGKQISTVKTAIGNVDICIYEKNTKSVVSHVNSSTIEYSGTSFSFYLATKITTAGLYFLYLPSTIIEFVNGTESPFTLIGYKIESDETGNDIQKYEYQSTGKTLEKIRIKFPNVGTYSIGIDVTKTITVKDNNGNTVLSPSNSVYNTTVTYLNKVSNNTVEFDLKKVINNPGSLEIVYTIEIPAETFLLSSEDYNTNITLLYTIIPESLDLPVDNNLIVKVEPSNNSNVFKLDKIKVKFYQDDYLSNSTNVWNNSNKTITLTYSDEVVASSSSPAFTKIEYEQGYKVFVFEFQLNNAITTSGLYTLNIPAEKFYIGVGNTASTAVTCNYNLIELKEEEYVNKYCYEMIQVIPTSNEIILHDDGIELSFKKENTIFIDRLKMSNILFSPVLSIIEEDNNEVQKVTYYNPFLNENDVLEMVSTLSVQLSDGTEKLETVVYNSKDSYNSSSGFLYGLDLNNNRVSYKLCNFSLGPTQETEGLFFKNERIGQVPRSMNLTIYIKLNGTSVLTSVNIQILDDEVYTKFKENNNWVFEKKIDVYSGEECDHVYVTPTPTENYDSLIKTITTNDLGELITKYEVDLTSVTKVRLGNLDGIYNETFGNKQPFGYGLYGLNVFLTGNFLLNNGRSMLDIDNDVTVAVGNIANILNGLSELENRLSENSRLFDKKISNAEKGVSSTISNYISTNKDAIFKLGLDYSMWTMGSSGIALYNPNVKYTTDENGNTIVDTTTVGDFDEGVLIQGDKVRINTYESILVNNVTYYKILVTTVNPKDWVYPDSANSGYFLPKVYSVSGSNQRDVPFYYYYMRQEDINLCVTDNTIGASNGVLRYACIMENEDGSPYIPETMPTENLAYLAYAFNTFYSIPTSVNITLYTILSLSPITLNTYNLTEQVWFLPSVNLAALFSNGKIKAKYIETKGLILEHLIAIPPLDLYSNTYRNPDFDITKEISNSNYPVLTYIIDSLASAEEGHDVYTTFPNKNIPFVIVSGYTGKITSKYADISGNVTIGDKDESNYIIISDNTKDEDPEPGTDPSLYIIGLETENNNTYKRVLTKLSGTYGGNLVSKYKEELELPTITQNETAPGSTFDFTHYTGRTTTEYVQEVHYYNSNTGMYEYLLAIQIRDIDSEEDRTIGGTYVTTTAVSKTVITPYGYINGIYNSANVYTYQFSEISSSNDGILKISYSGAIFPNSTYAGYTNLEWSGTIRCEVKFYIGEVSGNNVINETYVGKSYYTKTGNNSSGTTKYSINRSSSGTRIYNIKANKTYRIYCKIYDSSYYLVPYNTSYSSSKTMRYDISGLSCNVEIQSLSYMSEFTGNGLSLGFNENNYFGAYYLKGSTATNGTAINPRIGFEFRGDGMGLEFRGNKQYNLLPNGIKLPTFTPVIYFVIQNGLCIFIVPKPDSNYNVSNFTIYKNWVNEEFELISDYINVYAIKGDRDFTFPSSYSQDSSTSHPKSGSYLRLLSDAYYEFNFSKFISALGITNNNFLNAANTRIRMERVWGLPTEDGVNVTWNDDCAWVPKVYEVSNNCIYISHDLSINFLVQGQIDLLLTSEISEGDSSLQDLALAQARQEFNSNYLGSSNTPSGIIYYVIKDNLSNVWTNALTNLSDERRTMFANKITEINNSITALINDMRSTYNNATSASYITSRLSGYDTTVSNLISQINDVVSGKASVSKSTQFYWKNSSGNNVNNTTIYVAVLNKDLLVMPTLENTLNLSPITYTSSNSTIATISSTGALSITGTEGTTTISAKYTSGESDMYADTEVSYEISVHKSSSRLSWTRDDVSVSSYGTYTGNPLKNPNSVSGITYSSDGSSATIDTSTGEVTVINGTSGSTTITASFPGDTYYEATTISYVLTVAPLSFSTNDVNVIINSLGAAYTEVTEPNLENPNNLSVTYSSFNERVATVNSSTGEVTVVSYGTTYIYATSGEFSTSYRLQIDRIEISDSAFHWTSSYKSAVRGDIIENVLVYPSYINSSDITIYVSPSGKGVSSTSINNVLVSASAVYQTYTISAVFHGNNIYARKDDVEYSLSVAKNKIIADDEITPGEN